MTSHQKQELIATVKNLDPIQSEQVLLYIRNVLQPVRSRDVRQHSRKRKALREIGHALREYGHSF